MSDRQILEPYWASNLKNQIVCKFRYVDGQEVIASVSQTTEGNPDWDEIFQKFTVEEIDANTAAGAKLHEENRLKRQMEQQRQADNFRREALFMAKSDAFEVDLVRTSTNTELKSKLRKASSIMEVSILASMIALDNYNMQKVIANGETSTANTG
jgi:hypothetical protein